MDIPPKSSVAQRLHSDAENLKRKILEDQNALKQYVQPVYTNPVLLQNDSDLFICKLYQQARHVMEVPRNALEIYGSLSIDGVIDKEQGTREVLQVLRRRLPPLIEKVAGKEWDVFLNQEGIEYCERKCDEPGIRDRIISTP